MSELDDLRAENARLHKLVAEPTRAMFHPDSGIAVWLIPKNAHTSIQEYCMGQGFIRVPGGAVPDTNMNIVVLRDPVDRYISTVWTMWHHTTPRNLSNPPTLDTLKWEDWDWFFYSVLEWNVKHGEPWKHFGDNHFKSQADHIPDRPMTVVDFLDVQQLPKMLMIHAGVAACPLPHRMQGNIEAKGTALQMLEESDAAIIREHYSVDETNYRRPLD